MKNILIRGSELTAGYDRDTLDDHLSNGAKLLATRH